jgi:hypothetical protein
MIREEALSTHSYSLQFTKGAVLSVNILRSIFRKVVGILPFYS